MLADSRARFFAHRQTSTLSRLQSQRKWSDADSAAMWYLKVLKQSSTQPFGEAPALRDLPATHVRSGGGSRCRAERVRPAVRNRLRCWFHCARLDRINWQIAENYLLLAPDDHCAPDMFPHAVGPALAELGQGTLRSYVESKGCGAGHDLIISGHVIECGRHQEIVLGQFDLGWVRVANPGVPIAVAEIVAVEVHAFGLWSVNLSRIMQTIESATQFGFLYATTAHHAEQGEERFLIE